MRVPREPFFGLIDAESLKACAGTGIIKHLLLNYLSILQRKRIRQSDLTTARAFVGVLFTGCMTEDVVSRALKRLARRIDVESGEVEVLFHPGGAANDERELWEGGPELLNFYFSSNRQMEADALARISLPDGFTRNYNFLIEPGNT